MKKKKLLLFLLFVLFFSNIGKSQLVFLIKGGDINKIKFIELDEYTKFIRSIRTNNGESHLYLATVKYFVTPKFYFGVQFGQHTLFSDVIREVEYNNNEYDATIYYFYLNKKSLFGSVVVGHHLYKGFYAEIGYNNYFNSKTSISGHKSEERGGKYTSTDLSKIDYKEPNIHSINLGLGFSYRIKRFYFEVDYKYSFEKLISIKGLSTFKYALNYSYFTIGGGYYFNLKKKELKAD